MRLKFWRLILKKEGDGGLCITFSPMNERNRRPSLEQDDVSSGVFRPTIEEEEPSRSSNSSPERCSMGINSHHNSPVQTLTTTTTSEEAESECSSGKKAQTDEDCEMQGDTVTTTTTDTPRFKLAKEFNFENIPVNYQTFKETSSPTLATATAKEEEKHEDHETSQRSQSSNDLPARTLREIDQILFDVPQESSEITSPSDDWARKLSQVMGIFAGKKSVFGGIFKRLWKLSETSIFMEKRDIPRDLLNFIQKHSSTPVSLYDTVTYAELYCSLMQLQMEKKKIYEQQINSLKKQYNDLERRYADKCAKFVTLKRESENNQTASPSLSSASKEEELMSRNRELARELASKSQYIADLLDENEKLRVMVDREVKDAQKIVMDAKVMVKESELNHSQVEELKAKCSRLEDEKSDIKDDMKKDFAKLQKDLEVERKRVSTLQEQCSKLMQENMKYSSRVEAGFEELTPRVQFDRIFKKLNVDKMKFWRLGDIDKLSSRKKMEIIEEEVTRLRDKIYALEATKEKRNSMSRSPLSSTSHSKSMLYINSGNSTHRRETPSPSGSSPKQIPSSTTGGRRSFKLDCLKKMTQMSGTSGEYSSRYSKRMKESPRLSSKSSHSAKDLGIVTTPTRTTMRVKKDSSPSPNKPREVKFTSTEKFR
eukprot:CAMPEP_0115001126 /NCGR_PEP_ID=MMETSP0216-20121206/17180_1 /TAXON_ID=223996 /ORGANISM="Protocruzia adherens, Strain Boccale" /LENGTH=653 /DNA_ID=CAMNT_0002366381 /DNA_START=68 /DNA_END=2029 /DNA_ORIENTATION=+